MSEYRWSHPSEWLSDHLDDQTDLDTVRQLARDLASKLDGDQLQDLFQDEMDRDGYFTPRTPRTRRTP